MTSSSAARVTVGRGPLGFVVLVAGAGLAVLPWESRQLAAHAAFLPAVLAVVAVLDLLSGYVLLAQFRSEVRGRCPARLTVAQVHRGAPTGSGI